MKIRTLVLTLASLALGVILIAYLVVLGKIDFRDTLRKLSHLDTISFLVFTLLMALHILLSTQKWNIIDGVIRRPGDLPLQRSISFALSSGGVALGQFVPAAMGMAATRTLGTFARGRAFTRGTGATIFEHGFDFLFVCLLIPASVVTRLYKGGPVMWTSVALISTVTGLLAIGAAVRSLERFADWLAARQTLHSGHLHRALIGLRASGLLNAKVARKLALLSIARFVILVLMAGAATKAVGIEVPLWHLAGAMPFVVLSSIIAISPGALGVGELAYATALSLFGTPLSAAAQFALANRVLVVSASFIIAICAAGIVFLKGTLAYPEPRQSQGPIQ